MSNLTVMPGLGDIPDDAGLTWLDASSDGRFRVGADGVIAIATTGDRKVEFVAFREHTLGCVRSALGYPAYYPVHAVRLEKPIRAVLMDLDGTSVRSEGFWIWIIQMTIATLSGNSRFELAAPDLPYVSGHSVSEHLQYCIVKYCPDQTLENARRLYFEHAHREMQAILAGGGRSAAFTPAPGLKDFLLALKGMGVKIGLVTSGLYEKAYPEILAAFRTLGLGDPGAFYDAIITAGYPLRRGEVGTLGELSPKPHPWLYAEVARVGLGIPFQARHQVVGLEDSGAGVCAIRLAGFSTIGLAGGNIVESGTRVLCNHYCETLADALRVIRA
ncbi:MAG: haloacid dehalogenase [Chloroflexi bacterium HGW-Chloroflexi-1]|nr:MAG: haloacid dehalogenase [Chloroflexi bacterium HGW-Chloroflexi-1]